MNDVKVQSSRFKVQGSRFKVQGSKFKVQGSRFKVQGSKFKVQGSRFKAFLVFPSTINHKGFTLIEVLVSLAVVSGVFLMVLTSFSYHIDIFGSKKDSIKLVLRAKDNLYLYRTGKLIELAGTKDGIEYEIKTEDMEYNLKKVTSRARADKEEVLLLQYMRK